MDIDFGATVVDKEGNNLGQINHIINDTWTGEIKSVLICRKAPEKDLIIHVQDIARVETGRVYLGVSLKDLQ